MSALSGRTRIIAALCLGIPICACTASAPHTDNRGWVGVSSPDPLNTSYLIEQRPARLRDGSAARQVDPGSATTDRVQVSGVPALGDLDADGDDDAVLWLVHSPGGSGTFHYVAAAMFEAGTYHGGQATLIGDRIAPRSLRILNGVVEVNYHDREPDQAMAIPPARPQTLYLVWAEGALRVRGVSAVPAGADSRGRPVPALR